MTDSSRHADLSSVVAIGFLAFETMFPTPVAAPRARTMAEVSA
jgi:hypothetical protein